MHPLIPPGLHRLRKGFIDRGLDIRIVGGAVRDMLSGITPKDIDLATDATPAEQVAIYETGGHRHYETGIAHGTLTVMVDGMSFEVTTLRTEQDHDGRRALTKWSRDWTDDLSRRDLTINAMALTFDGTLIDPFGGAEDLINGRVRFVGDPKERMREDYLRVLRWLRFHARIAPDAPLDQDAVAAVMLPEVHRGIPTLSAERVWQEMSRLLEIDGGVKMLREMVRMDLTRWIRGMPCGGNLDAIERAHRTCRVPSALIAVYVNDEVALRQLAEDWRWSTEERELGLFIVHMAKKEKVDWKRMLACDGAKKEWVIIAMQALGAHAALGQEILQWHVPTFPVSGHDLMALGIKAGPLLGQTLAKLRHAWAESDFVMSKEDLLKLV